jgi:hypothetical protein
LDPLLVRVLTFSAGGWLSAGVCTLASARHVRRLLRYAPPSVDEVRARLASAGSESERGSLVLDLREQRAEAERALSLATLLPRTMARVALASGTALALTSLAHGLPTAGPALTAGAAVGFAGGFLGMVSCSEFGRQAKGRAGEMRQNWKRAAETAEREWTRGKASG